MSSKGNSGMACVHTYSNDADTVDAHRVRVLDYSPGWSKRLEFSLPFDDRRAAGRGFCVLLVRLSSPC